MLPTLSPPRAGHQLSLLQVGLSGGWQYLWRYSGFDRRGRFPGYSQVINAYRDRLIGKEGHQGAYFYLLTYARRPELTATEGAAQLTAVVKPVLERVSKEASQRAVSLRGFCARRQGLGRALLCRIRASRHPNLQAEMCMRGQGACRLGRLNTSSGVVSRWPT